MSFAFEQVHLVRPSAWHSMQTWIFIKQCSLYISLSWVMRVIRLRRLPGSWEAYSPSLTSHSQSLQAVPRRPHRFAFDSWPWAGWRAWRPRRPCRLSCPCKVALPSSGFSWIIYASDSEMSASLSPLSMAICYQLNLEMVVGSMDSYFLFIKCILYI